MLRELGHKPVVIDYHNWKRRLHAREPKELMRQLLRLGVERVSGSGKRQRRSDAFRKEHLSLSAVQYRSQDALYDDPPLLDAYVTGSDQVWNPQNNGFDQAHFLTFAPQGARKIAYAASFGVSTLPRRYWGDYRLWISQIDHVSVREVDGARIVSEVAGVPVEVVLDPTLLIDAYSWRRISVPPSLSRPYVLCYHVTNDQQNAQWISNTAQQVSSITGWSIVVVGRQVLPQKGRSIKDLTDAGPLDFLGLVDNASAVVTDSFHGVAFSVTFRKPFFLVLNTDFSRNSRLTHLVEELGLKTRLWYSVEPVALEPEMIELEYKNASSRLAEERRKFWEFQKCALHGIE